MSDLWTSPSGEEEAASRRRALWGLVVLVAIGVLVGSLMVFLGRSHTGRGGDGLAGGAPTASSQPAVSAVTSQTSPPAASPTSLQAASSRPPSQTGTASRCPSAAPCVLPGDGGAVAALNAFRTSHGLPAVPGTATSQAQQCALNQGDGPSCAPHYAWQPVSTREGAQVISMIASRSDGMAWLLDPSMTSFSVGWAFAPGAGGSGQYECAILKVG